MILVTTETVSGREQETLGMVKGSTIQTVNAVRDIGAGLKTLVGGESPRNQADGGGSGSDGRRRGRVREIRLRIRHAECRGSSGLRNSSEIQITGLHLFGNQLSFRQVKKQK